MSSKSVGMHFQNFQTVLSPSLFASFGLLTFSFATSRTAQTFPPPPPVPGFLLKQRKYILLQGSTVIFFLTFVFFVGPPKQYELPCRRQVMRTELSISGRHGQVSLSLLYHLQCLFLITQRQIKANTLL